MNSHEDWEEEKCINQAEDTIEKDDRVLIVSLIDVVAVIETDDGTGSNDNFVESHNPFLAVKQLHPSSKVWVESEYMELEIGHYNIEASCNLLVASDWHATRHDGEQEGPENDQSHTESYDNRPCDSSCGVEVTMWDAH